MSPDNGVVRLLREQAEAAHDLRSSSGGLTRWVGRVVKIGFDQDLDIRVNKEWMWVEVQGVRDGKLVGVLLNQPRFATYVKRGGEVVFAETDIVGLDTPARR